MNKASPFSIPRYGPLSLAEGLFEHTHSASLSAHLCVHINAGRAGVGHRRPELRGRGTIVITCRRWSVVAAALLRLAPAKYPHITRN